jgi:hypothetical protein
MKLERNGIIAIVFGITFAILLLFNFLTSGFRFELKGILVSIYFAVWIGAVTFVLFTFVIPFIKVRKEEKKKAKTTTFSGVTAAPFKSPRSGLPIRERITTYVTERRREDGLPAPEPLKPARPVSGAVASAAIATGVATAGSAHSVSPKVQEPSVSGNEDLGELPLPDDFGSVESSGETGELPGLDDDFGSFDELEGGDEITSDFGDDNSNLLGDDGGSQPIEPAMNTPAASASDDLEGGLPGFEGDLESDIGESEIMGDDSMMDLGGDDLLVMDEETSVSPTENLPDGDISEAGLPDLDEALEPDMMESDLSGADEDFGDIEFMDLEPEEPEPKKPSKK